MPNLKPNLIRLATRKSALAQVQAHQVKDLLLAHDPSLQIEFVYFSTQGDEILERPLAEIGGKALFIKTLEEGLLQNKADIAVHSLKDVPSMLPENFSLLAYLEREDPADVFLSRQFSSFAELPLGASVGTSSPRRSAQVKYARPDLNIKMLRGNVPTRIEKILAGEFDAGILAYAGLKRLGLTSKIQHVFPTDFLLPAPGQGVIAVECLASRHEELRNIREVLNHRNTEKIAIAERSFAAALGGDCYSPIAALGQINNAEFLLSGSVHSKGGSKKIMGQKTVKNLSDDLSVYKNIGRDLALELLSQNAGELLTCH